MKINNIQIKEVNQLDNQVLSKKITNNSFFYHTNNWKRFISSSFNLSNKDQSFIIAINQKTNKIETIFPITKIKSHIFGNRIISTAYQEYGGITGEKNHLNKILNFIYENYQKKFEYLEIRGAINQDNNSNPENINNQKFHKKINYKRFILNLSNQEQAWKNIQKSKRKAIKKAEKECTCRELNVKDLNQFYKLYLQNMRNFGSPPYNKQYFYNFLTTIQQGNFGKIYGCFKDNKLISALLGFTYNRTVHITTAISNPNYAKNRPSDLMHWEFIKWAANNNFHTFDFGLVREESGQFEYKRKWGSKLYELPSYYFLLKSKKVPKVLDPSNSKYQLAIKIWQHLPLKITEIIGMKLRKKIGI